MKENKHGFEPKQEFIMGGIAWTVIQTGANWVKCIASDCVEERSFDAEKRNDFAASDICAYLNGEFLRRLNITNPLVAGNGLAVSEMAMAE